MKTPPPRTATQARQWLDEQGMSQAEVARRFDVTSSLVDAILRGTKACKRGASHNIAVFLGLKHGQAVANKRQLVRSAAIAAIVASPAAPERRTSTQDRRSADRRQASNAGAAV